MNVIAIIGAVVAGTIRCVAAECAVCCCDYTYYMFVYQYVLCAGSAVLPRRV